MTKLWAGGNKDNDDDDNDIKEIKERQTFIGTKTFIR